MAAQWTPEMFGSRVGDSQQGFVDRFTQSAQQGGQTYADILAKQEADKISDYQKGAGQNYQQELSAHDDAIAAIRAGHDPIEVAKHKKAFGHLGNLTGMGGPQGAQQPGPVAPQGLAAPAQDYGQQVAQQATSGLGAQTQPDYNQAPTPYPQDSGSGQIMQGSGLSSPAADLRGATPSDGYSSAFARGPQTAKDLATLHEFGPKIAQLHKDKNDTSLTRELIRQRNENDRFDKKLEADKDNKKNAAEAAAARVKQRTTSAEDIKTAQRLMSADQFKQLMQERRYEADARSQDVQKRIDSVSKGKNSSNPLVLEAKEISKKRSAAAAMVKAGHIESEDLKSNSHAPTMIESGEKQISEYDARLDDIFSQLEAQKSQGSMETQTTIQENRVRGSAAKAQMPQAPTRDLGTLPAQGSNLPSGAETTPVGTVKQGASGRKFIKTVSGWSPYTGQ